MITNTGLLEEFQLISDSKMSTYTNFYTRNSQTGKLKAHVKCFYFSTLVEFFLTGSSIGNLAYAIFWNNTKFQNISIDRRLITIFFAAHVNLPLLYYSVVKLFDPENVVRVTNRLVQFEKNVL